MNLERFIFFTDAFNVKPIFLEASLTLNLNFTGRLNVKLRSLYV